MPDDDALMSTAEVATYLGLSWTRVNQLLREGRIPYERVGAFRVVRQSDAEAFRQVPRPTGVHRDGDELESEAQSA